MVNHLRYISQYYIVMHNPLATLQIYPPQAIYHVVPLPEEYGNEAMSLH